MVSRQQRNTRLQTCCFQHAVHVWKQMAILVPLCIDICLLHIVFHAWSYSAIVLHQWIRLTAVFLCVSAVCCWPEAHSVTSRSNFLVLLSAIEFISLTELHWLSDDCKQFFRKNPCLQASPMLIHSNITNTHSATSVRKYSKISWIYK